MHTLVVLMWRDLMVSKRRPIYTVYRMAMPLLFLVLIYLFKNDIKPKMAEDIKKILHESKVKFSEERFLDASSRGVPTCLLYSPNSELAGTIMDEVASQMRLTRKSSLPEKKYCSGYYPFSNFSDITEYVNVVNENAAVIIFEDMSASTWSERKEDRLTYTIRMKEQFKTNTFRSSDDMVQSHSTFGDSYDGFMYIQWAIDTSYIKVRTGNTVPQKLSLQEFPFYTSNQDTTSAMIGSLIFAANFIGCMDIFMNVMTRMMRERATGVQELIKLSAVSGTILNVGYFVYSLLPALVFSAGSTVLVTATDNPLIANTSGLLIFFVLALYVASVTTCGMAFSYIAHSTQYATMISMFSYISTVVVAKVVDAYRPTSLGLQLLAGLLPHVPLSWMWHEVVHFEHHDKALKFVDIGTAHTAETRSVVEVVLFLVLQTLVYIALTWYLSHVRQGQYGNSLPWNFLCLKGFWHKNEINPQKFTTTDEEVLIAREAKYFEDPPRGMEVGIRIENVSKFYPKNKALDNVSLDVYNGEITVLLGHNGAGKTTLMSIITGMITATSGKVYVNGLEIGSAGLQVRKRMAFCPQHNLFLENLDVLEHVMFFTMLKDGSSFAAARASSGAILEQLGIGCKGSCRPSALSGGMRRRLQLACALAGGSDVLVLDEPTSGLDVETRRDLWNLLLSLRGARTVLLSTHFMEEADALGDRVAALHSGSLRCHATTMFLKKAMGTGYRLTFTTRGVPKESQITSAVCAHVAEAGLRARSCGALCYSLPAAATPRFPALFSALEDHRAALGIETIGVGVSTLEEVFLKLCSDLSDTVTEETQSEMSAPEYIKKTGCVLYWRQAMALFKRHLRFTKANIIMLAAMHIALPATLMFMFTNATNNEVLNNKHETDLLLDLDIYKSIPQRRGFLDINATGAAFLDSNQYKGVIFDHSNNITKDILEIGKKNIMEYSQYLVGLELDNEHAKALYTTIYRHAAPVALNLLSNVLAAEYLPGGARIAVHNHPLGGAAALVHTPIVEAKALSQCLMWALLAVFLMLLTNANFGALPNKEGASGVRHVHVMLGCPAALHWLCTLAYHAAAACLTTVPIVLACAVAADHDDTLGQPRLLMTFALVLVLGSVAFFGLMYALILSFGETAANLIVLFTTIVFGAVTPLFKTAAGFFNNDINIFLKIFLAVVSYTMPPHTMTVAAGKIAYVGRLNALCDLNRGRCPDIGVGDGGFDEGKCCAGEPAKAYFAFDDYSPGAELLILIAQGIVYMVIVICIQQGYFNCLYDRMRNSYFKQETASSQDELVAAEALYAQKEIQRPKNQIDATQAMLVSGLHKNYPSVFSKDVHAVKGIGFSVKKGECFGLLGTNGAGKSTTFKMLTAEEYPTRGEVYANGQFLKKNKTDYLKSIGYCPQFSGIDEFQTGAANLRTLLTLRGLDDRDIEKELRAWIEVVGLQKYADTAAGSYSGGWQRRLAAAGALCWLAPLSLLDEPTAGVDVGARRRVHAALRSALRQGRSVVITSHSMDEMEALCARIAIMVAGSVRALGTPAELRARHAQGHAVVFKITHARDELDGHGKSEVDSLKNTLGSKFECILKDEHKTMLHYHINDKLNYSDLFLKLEDLQKSFPNLIEDYSVTETTLEEVFLHFAKEHHEAVVTNERNGNGIV